MRKVKVELSSPTWKQKQRTGTETLTKRIGGKMHCCAGAYFHAHSWLNRYLEWGGELLNLKTLIISMFNQIIGEKCQQCTCLQTRGVLKLYMSSCCNFRLNFQDHVVALHSCFGRQTLNFKVEFRIRCDVVLCTVRSHSAFRFLRHWNTQNLNHTRL